MPSERGKTKAPDSPTGSLNVVDFEQPNPLWAVGRSLDLMAPGKKQLLIIAAALQISLGLLDLLGIMLVGLVAAVAVSGIGVTSIPEWVQNGIDAVGLGSLTVTQLSVAIAVAAVFILVLKTVLSAFLSRRIMYFLAHRQVEASVRLASQFLQLPLADVNRWTTSEAVYALGPGTSAATVALLGSAITAASEVFLFAIIGIALLVYDPILTLAAGAFFGLIVFFLNRVLSTWTARNAETMKLASIDTLTSVSEAISTYREATVLNRRDLYITRYEQLVQRGVGASASNTFLVEVPKYVLEAALYLGVLVLGAVQLMTKDWGAAAATIALFMAAGSRVTPSLLRLQGSAITFRNSLIAAQPTFFMNDFLAERRGESSAQDARITATRIHNAIESGYPDFDATIRANSCTLTYADAERPALVNADFVVLEGSSVAFVGPTGAGKSTLSDVLLGVLEPDTGSVTISGVSPRIAIDRWPGAITYVPQAVALVGGSVRANVALGLPREAIDDELVWDALRRAHLADFLIKNREGLDTSVGERGFRLSGGQRQRLGIARALYTRPKLLVLDEATSALDAETELAITQTLDELEGKVTTVTVAHRLATVRNVDLVLYLNHGHIVARGTFDEVRQAVPDFDHQAKLLGL